MAKKVKPIQVGVELMAKIYKEVHEELFEKLPAGTKQRVLDALTDPNLKDERVDTFVRAVTTKAESRAYDLENPEN